MEKLLNELDSDINTNTCDIYNTTKKELEQIEKEEANSIIFRSKMNWYEHGEKNTKFFLNLEKKITQIN